MHIKVLSLKSLTQVSTPQHLSSPSLSNSLQILHRRQLFEILTIKNCVYIDMQYLQAILGQGPWETDTETNASMWGSSLGLNTFWKVKEGRAEEVNCESILRWPQHVPGVPWSWEDPSDCPAYSRIPILILLSLPLPMGGVPLGESARSASTPKRAQLRSFSQASSPFLKGWNWVAHHSIHYTGTDLLVLFSFYTQKRD